MCQHDTGLPDPEPHRSCHPAGLTRRQLLRGGAGVLAASALLPGAARLVVPTSAWAATSPDGLAVVPMAMHVHGSFSEGASGVSASWETQLTEARAAGVQVVWATDHDWRMSAWTAPDAFHTASLTETVQGRRYRWQPQPTGALAVGVAAAVTSPTAPADPARVKGALRLAATGATDAAATQRLYLDGSAGNTPHRTNVTGQVLSLQVLPRAVGPDSWGELLVTLSHHPATGGRPEGRYQLSYRFGTAPAAVDRLGTLGIVTVPVTAGEWNEVRLDLAADVARAWPDLVAADNALTDVWVGATSVLRQPVEVLFAWLRFTRDTAGDRPLQVQSGLLDAYASRFPDVVVHPGLEVSATSAHVNGFGGTRTLPDYTTGDAARAAAGDPGSYTAWSARLVHAQGGLASLNHPFGSSPGQVTQAQQDTARRALAARLLATRAYGVDLLEVGYRQRGGASLTTHLALWDALSRGGVWLTGNGVNDAHGGPQNDWRKLGNRFVTTALAGSTGQGDLLAALAAGRVFVAELGGFSGLLDLSAGACPMGSVSVRPGESSRTVTVAAAGLPAGSVVTVVQGPVDHGTSVDPGSAVVAQLPASAFATGSAGLTVDTSRSSFVRVEVRTSTGKVVAFSNPVWLLQEPPPVAPATPRRSPDSTA